MRYADEIDGGTRSNAPTAPATPTLGGDLTADDLRVALEFVEIRLKVGPRAHLWETAIVVKKLLDERLALKHEIELLRDAS